MIKIVAAAALTVFTIYDATTAPGSTGGLETRQQPTRELKGDRLPVRALGSSCSEAPWSYSQSNCLRDRAQPGGPAPTIRSVRIVTTDHLASGSLAPLTT